MSEFQPILDCLPAAQQRVWELLGQIPSNFVLYGGTAIALQLGHRQSIDFDFFSSISFRPDDLIRSMPMLANGERLQSEADTLTVELENDDPVMLSFFGSLAISRVGEPQRSEGNGVTIASLLDLSATKMSAIQDRAESKDYLDIIALMEAGITLEQALGAACSVYGEHFNAAISLKALAYFEDGDLPTLPEDVQTRLSDAAAAAGQLPIVPAVSHQLVD